MFEFLLMTLSLLLVGADEHPATADSPPLRYCAPNQREAQSAYEARLNDVVSAKSLRRFHDLLGESPHVAGSENDLRDAERLANLFAEWGLEVEKQELWVYLPEPKDAAVEIVSPTTMKLDLKEKPIPEDPFTSRDDVSIGWNAYSGSGDVTAQVVYANFGTKEDFEKLREIGVDAAGKIVIARYGGNYRGNKARFAEAAGAAGLIIYTDPFNSGYCQGLMYPEGGYANPTSIERGSIKPLTFAGDPLTPFEPATKDAKRIEPEAAVLPKIPVQPIGWGAAQEILSRMKGGAVPKGWQGGLPFTYRVTGGEDLTVRLMVRQSREIRKVINVLGTLRGRVHPGQRVIIGCHYDAWTFGASDPLAGSIVLMEAARSFSQCAREGRRPARSIVFANWAAEEFGIIGSTEWVEANRQDLLEHGVAYINLDMAAMGMEFGSSASPSLQSVILDAVASARRAGDPDFLDEWVKRDGDELFPNRPNFGSLGGGSDHVGFYCHAAVPSAGLGADGAPGTAYHSAYDTLHWYRKTVGDDYAPAEVVTRVVNVLCARLANATLLPLDPVRYAVDFRRHLDTIVRRAHDLRFEVPLGRLDEALRQFEDRASRAHAYILSELENRELTPEEIDCVNGQLLKLERCWYYEAGLPGGIEWYRNLFAAVDPDAGYSAWMLPALRWSVEMKSADAVAIARKAYYRAFFQLIDVMDTMESCLDE